VRVTIRHFEASEREWAALGDEIFAAAVQLAEQSALSDANAEVELVDGSLKAKAALVGALMVYGAIADYKGFKESLAEMAHDARAFATTIQETIPQIVSQKRDISRQDVRKGKIVVTAEELSKLIERLEKLKEKSKTISPAELSAELEKVERGFIFLRRNLDKEDLAIATRHLAEGKFPLPERQPKMPLGTDGMAIMRPDTFEELRRRIEEAAPAVHMARSGASEPQQRRPRRRMYFKRAPVRATESDPKLL
jgi:hypothetical protein